MAGTERLSYPRKYRPSTIKGYIGNEKLKETVMSAVKSDNKPQSILLYGNSGCGKTTMARIIAKEYNCESPNENGACGVCVSCMAMDEYITTGSTDNIANIKEIDVGSTGKTEVDAMLADLDIPTFGDEWKVYIFDEIQKATDALQTRLLKIVEEPPENVLFMFCTTNPEKLYDTLKNRCQLKLHVQKPKLPELCGLLKNVCETEGVEYDNRGLELIVNRSELVIRESLQNLYDCVIQKNSAKYSDVSSIFEEVSGKQLINFYKYLKRRDTFSFVTLIHDVKSKMELSVFLSELKAFTVRGIYIANGLTVDGVAENELAVYKNLFGEMSVEETGYLLDKLLSISFNNIELELLLMGYEGIHTSKVVTEKAEVPNVSDMTSEVDEENKFTNSLLKEKEKESYEKGVEQAESMLDSVGLDALLQMGGTVVN